MNVRVVLADYDPAWPALYEVARAGVVEEILTGAAGPAAT
jgi:hypothetical protein